VDAAVEVFRRHYAEVNGERTVIYPGVVEALAAFAAAGVPMACVTNKPAAFTGPLLERTGIARFFGVTVSGDTLPDKKPHPAPLLHACASWAVPGGCGWMIGDSANDAEAARAAGMPVLLVTYGYSEGMAGGQHRMRRATIQPRRCAAAHPHLNSRTPIPS
jgi:phosphoglycolate phosphatase